VPGKELPEAERAAIRNLLGTFDPFFELRATMPLQYVTAFLLVAHEEGARRRRHPNTVAIGILNLFLGWTFLGWVAALVWANFVSSEETIP
jgi:hypothetical protein